MNDNQEYAKFWLSIKNKCEEVQKDYNNLSDENKHRIDNLGNLILSAQNISQVVNIINNQIK